MAQWRTDVCVSLRGTGAKGALRGAPFPALRLHPKGAPAGEACFAYSASAPLAPTHSPRCARFPAMLTKPRRANNSLRSDMLALVSAVLLRFSASSTGNKGSQPDRSGG